MKKTNRITRGILLLLALVFGLSMAGCTGPQGKNFGDQTNGLYLMNDLYIQDSLVENFDITKYNLKEYEGFLDDELAEYNANHPFTAPAVKTDRNGNALTPEVTCPIEKKVCEVKTGWIYQQLRYATAEDFMTYNAYTIRYDRGGTKLLVGKFDGEIDAELLGAQYVKPDGKAVSIDELYFSKNAADYRYIAVDFTANLYGEGNLVAYSTNGVYSMEGGYVAAEAGQWTIAIFEVE